MGCFSSPLAWKADTSFKILKSGIRPKWIKSRPEQDAWVKMLIITFFKRRHRIILIAERRVHARQFRASTLGS